MTFPSPSMVTRRPSSKTANGNKNGTPGPDSWWFYFHKRTPFTAMCLQCERVVPRGARQSTNSLRCHLRSAHPELSRQRERAVREHAERAIASMDVAGRQGRVQAVEGDGAPMGEVKSEVALELPSSSSGVSPGNDDRSPKRSRMSPAISNTPLPRVLQGRLTMSSMSNAVGSRRSLIAISQMPAAMVERLVELVEARADVIIEQRISRGGDENARRRDAWDEIVRMLNCEFSEYLVDVHRCKQRYRRERIRNRLETLAIASNAMQCSQPDTTYGHRESFGEALSSFNAVDSIRNAITVEHDNVHPHTFTNNHAELDGDGGRSNGNNRFLMEDEEDEVDASQTQTQQGDLIEGDRDQHPTEVDLRRAQMELIETFQVWRDVGRRLLLADHCGGQASLQTIGAAIFGNAMKATLTPNSDHKR